MNNKILKLAMVLFLICAVTAGVLGIVNALTWERIDQITHQKEYEAYAAVLGSDSGYTAVEFDKTAFPTVDSVNQSNDGNGYVVTSTFSGAQGPPVSVQWRLLLPQQVKPSVRSLSDRMPASPSPRRAAASTHWPVRPSHPPRSPTRRRIPSPVLHLWVKEDRTV